MGDHRLKALALLHHHAHAVTGVFFFHFLVRIGGRTVGRELKCANGNEMFDLGGQWVGRYVTV